MFKTERQEEILNILKQFNYATVEYLAQQMHMSPSSIRRDLRALEAIKIVKRSYGGVTLLQSENVLTPFQLRIHEHNKEKKSIAKAAARLVKEGDTVFIDGSSSALNMIEFLRPDYHNIVFTNNLKSALMLVELGIETYCIGGLISAKNGVVSVGHYAEEMIKNIYVDIMFFSSSAISLEGNITDVCESETSLRREMLKHSKCKVFLCDESRMGKISIFQVCNIDKIDYVISNRPFREEFLKEHEEVSFIVND